jgi:drug/metabolite transporter (DMT)-like permease
MTALLFLIALTTLSSSPLFVKWSEASIEFLGFWRLTIAGLLFFLFVSFKRGPRSLLSGPLKSWLWPALSGLFFFLHLWTYVAAAKTTSVAHLMILFATNPIFTVAGAAFFFQEKLRKRVVVAYPLAFLGLWILVGEKVSYAPDSRFGDIMAVLSAVLHSGYLLCSKKARVRFDNFSFSIALYWTAGLLFGALALLRGVPLESTTFPAWGAVAGLILFPTFLGHALMTQLVNKMDLSVLSCGKLLEPGISTVMAYFLFGETISLRTLAAFALTGTSVLILFWPRRWSPGAGRSAV